MIRKQIISAGTALIVVLMLSSMADAALGGGADSVATDRKALQAVHRATTSRNGYTVEEVESDAAVVREYVSLSGVVFGIAWNGYVHPDLTQLLGTYWGEYSSSLRKEKRTHGRKRQHLKSNTLIVEKWGHMRDLRGRAYVPGLVPAGMSSDEIK